MSEETCTPRSAGSSNADKDQPSALDHEAKHVENIMHPKDDDGAQLEKQERILQVDQDARVQAGTREAKDAGTGSNEPHESLNKDG